MSVRELVQKLGLTGGQVVSLQTLSKIKKSGLYGLVVENSTDERKSTSVSICTLAGNFVYRAWLTDVEIDWLQCLRCGMNDVLAQQKEDIRMAGVHQDILEALTS